MPIYAPGVSRNSKAGIKRRDVVALLQLTAMVDMFTVLVVFLLQNYAVTNQILPISEKIMLPKAEKVKNLKPSHVVVLSKDVVSLNSESLGKLTEHTSLKNWTFAPLKTRMQEIIKESEKGLDTFLANQLNRVVSDEQVEELKKQAPFRVTIQADEEIVFLDIKKIMYTLTEAGVKEMNFAVIKLPDTGRN